MNNEHTGDLFEIRAFEEADERMEAAGKNPAKGSEYCNTCRCAIGDEYPYGCKRDEVVTIIYPDDGRVICSGYWRYA